MSLHRTSCRSPVSDVGRLQLVAPWSGHLARRAAGWLGAVADSGGQRRQAEDGGDGDQGELRQFVAPVEGGDEERRLDRGDGSDGEEQARGTQPAASRPAEAGHARHA